MKQLKELLNDPLGDEKEIEKMEALYKKMEEELKKTQLKISDLLERVIAYEDATVEVTGEITPGTLIEICQTALFVTTPLKKVRVRLDQQKSKLVIDNL
jgi:hypothetical protein